MTLVPGPPWSVRLLVGVLALSLAAAQGYSQQSRRTTYQDAYDGGYLDGVEAGRQDQQKGRSFQLINKGAFQQAQRGFDPAQHRADVYRIAYRRGFKDGYEIGYRGPAGSSRLEKRGRADADSSPTLKRVRDTSDPVTVPAGTEIRVRLLQQISTRANEPGDRFRTEVLEDVLVASQVAIPRGAPIWGSVARLKKAGRLGWRSEMNLQFRELRLSGRPPTVLDALLVSVLAPPSDPVIRAKTTLLDEGSGLREKDERTSHRGIGPWVDIVRGDRRQATVRNSDQSDSPKRAWVTGGRHIELAPDTELTIRLSSKLILPAAVLSH